MKRILFSIGLLLFSTFFSIANINYELSITDPGSHLVDVSMTIDSVSGDEVLVKIPVWAPGSYLIREFAKNIGSVVATDSKGTKLTVQKTKKNAWKIMSKGATSINLKYSVFCNELSVRTSYIDGEMAYINPSSVFMYASGRENEMHSFSFKNVERWKNTSVALPMSKGVYEAADYDLLVDSPILVSNHSKHSFKDGGKTYHLAIEGDGNYSVDKLKTDLAKVITTTAEVVDRGRPYDEYTFIILNTDDMYGGLEHLYSTSLIYPRNAYGSEDRYFGFLSLACHEYFHLWNVKRIRPIELGPFNYDEENYTRQLWVAEGITSYYDEYLMLRSEFIDGPGYLHKLASGIANTENTPGNTQQSLADASYDAWIKFYRRSEISQSCCISYYTKGAVVSAMLDLIIRKETNNDQSLDNVMQLLWDDYYVGAKRGFTEEEMIAAVSKISGTDMQWFFDDYIYDVKPVDYQKFLGYAGLDLKRNQANKPYLGIGLDSGGAGHLSITSVSPLSAAHDAGLQVGDEIMAIGEYRTTDSVSEVISNFEIGDTVNFTIARGDKVLQVPVKMRANPRLYYSIEPLPNANKKQRELYRAWIGESL